ncbi:short-chain dehydrogenase/reductase [Bordetella genomosp. 8]|uniref:Short-chain dehydrogenase/reductase n=1 Tax=Bordetella genomosp. 8 TaxID=1416806 RepID=A0A1W6YF00_9BORD|nr:oxidoreductase [Bordetella genomosp. 8]ARP79647.1 short-chain dehydrogenase/reductase [Bordetella genomosp. 8]
MSTATHASPVWFITGCSTGFGRALAQAVIARGWPVVATARDAARLDDLVRQAPDRVLAVALDVTDSAAIDAAVRAALERFGRIDVLVNNAGYGYQSTVEEGVEAEIRAQFDANVFGLFAMTRAVLPGMRERRRGHVINITSVAGLVGFPSSGYYAASKHAVEGFSDALAAEVAHLGIQVTCVEPGPFRTDWAGRSLRQTPTRIADYADSAAKRMESTRQNSGKQIGDPDRAAQAMIHITEIDTAPRHLVLGAFGVKAVTDKLRERLAQIEQWRDAALAADFPE